MSMTQHKIRPLWEKIKSTDIGLSMTVDGVALGDTWPVLLETFQGGKVGFVVELKGKAEVGSVHVVCRQTRHWGSMQIKLAQGADGRFKGSLNLSKMDLSPRESFQFEAIIHGKNFASDPRPIGRSQVLTIARHKADKVPETNWSYLEQRQEDFAASRNIRLNSANKHLWRLLFENSRVTIYWNINGPRREHYDILRATQADPAKESIRSLLNAIVARSAMAVQQSWDMLHAANLQSTDSSAFGDVPMIAGLKLTAQLIPGPADLDNLGSLLCEVEFQERVKQKGLFAQMERSLKLLMQAD
jgi:hypothetical protein